MSGVRQPESVGGTRRPVAVRGVWATDLGDGRHDLPGHAESPDYLVPGDVVRDQYQDRHQRAGAATGAGPRQLSDGVGVLHKLRRAMVRPGRDRLAGRVEVDETLVGGVGGARGRSRERKARVVVAAEEVGRGIGRIRMRRIPDGAAKTLQEFIDDTIEPGSEVHTDGWDGYERVKQRYHHRVTYLRGHHALAAELLPRVHRVASLLKRWLLGTHQGAVSQAHLDYYLDEFTFRFNRRASRHRGKLFFRLVQQAVAVEPVPYRRLVQPGARSRRRPHN